MQIKDVEKKTGLTKRAIRYYEQQGLITTTRGKNRYKIYRKETLETLLNIKRLRILGVSVKEINMMISGENVEDIILKKLEENEQTLKKAYGVKQILNKMLQGEKIEHIDADRLLLEEKKKSYMYIRHHNFIFGLLNVFIFIFIHLFMFSQVNKMGVFDQLYVLVMLQLIVVALWLGYTDRSEEHTSELQSSGH